VPARRLGRRVGAREAFGLRRFTGAFQTLARRRGLILPTWRASLFQCPIFQGSQGAQPSESEILKMFGTNRPEKTDVWVKCK